MCVEFLHPFVHVWFSGSRAAVHKYRAGGGKGVWQRLRLRIGLHALGYRERTTGLGWALHC